MKNNQPTYEETTRKEEIINIITHGAGIPLAIAGLVLLIKNGWEKESWLYMAALVIYGLTMLWTYTTSTVYHSLYKAHPRKRNVYHLLDHTAIYLFIAGTYTPIALFVLPGMWSIGIFSGIWALALIGVVFKVFFLGKFKKLSLVIYLLMGWMIVIAIKPLINHASTDLLFWILAGGACYSLGTVFFSLRRMPYSHGVWHLLVLGGSICHFVGIYLYV